jgi:hypothetical protein
LKLKPAHLLYSNLQAFDVNTAHICVSITYTGHTLYILHG